jgi:hypothetical protein
MDSKVSDSRLPPRPTTNAEAENAALATQVLETGLDEKKDVASATEQDGETATKAKKAPQAGMKNYFVSTPPQTQFHANIISESSRTDPR